MALIRHLCTKCGHPDYWRYEPGKPDGSYSGSCWCGCKCRCGPAEVVPTWDNAGQRVERIAEPGRPLNETTRLIPCGCEDCKALYAQLTTL